MAREARVLTEDQVKIVLDGIRNGVEYKEIAERAGLPHQRAVGRFMERYLISQINKSREDKSLE